VPEARERVALGQTGLRVTRLGLGCAPLGNMFTALGEEQARATVAAAWDLGLRWFDTAPLYGHGLSEKRLGAALKGRPRAEFVLATKVGRLLEPGVDPASIFADTPPVRPRFDFTRDGVLRSVEASLERLGVDRIDVLHVHDPDDHEEEAIEGAFRALRRLREEGSIAAVGAGMNQSAMLARFAERGLVDCVLVAGRYTLLDPSAADDLLPAARRAGVAVIAAGVFNSGVLAEPRNGATYDYVAAPAAVVERAQAISAVCRRYDVPLRAAALQFPTTHPAVTTVLSGARSPAEIEENVRLFGHPIPPDLWTAIRAEHLTTTAPRTQ
jgi:D-threo-aldose 1-dehydrogenase